MEECRKLVKARTEGHLHRFPQPWKHGPASARIVDIIQPTLSSEGMSDEDEDEDASDCGTTVGGACLRGNSLLCVCVGEDESDGMYMTSSISKSDSF